MLYNNLDELIGHTPLLKATAFSSASGLKNPLLVKLECFNPAGSVKDRAVKYMIDDAEARGLLKKGSTVVEATSGNTGIAICAICSARGYGAIIVMPDNMSEERVKAMSAYGAKVVLTPAALGMQGALDEAENIRSSLDGAVTLGQFVNPANSLAHYKTTGAEIFDDCNGKIDVFVAGVGTGGTISGVARFLKEKLVGVEIVAVQPKSSQVLSGLKPSAHKIQGIGANFVPRLFERELIDEIASCSDEDAFNAARLFARTEGVLVGISSGAALSVAVEIAKSNPDKKVVCLAPDIGMRYFSTELYQSN